MTSRVLSIVLVSAVVLAARAQVPQPTPTPRALRFEAGIEIVNLTVSVTDRRSRYVTGLDQEQFAVFEDGVRQELSLFTHENLPISLVLIVDTSASMDEKLSAAQTAAIRFIKTLRPQDLAQLVQFNDRITVLQDFTADHGKLGAAVMNLKASGPTALHNALYVSLKELGKQKDAGGELRRRAVVLLSDGEDTASLVDDEQVIELARQVELSIYAIRLRRGGVRDRDRMSFSQATHLLTTLTRDTGGQVHFPNSVSELDAVYDRIAEELRTQYSIGYVSNNAQRDGKWRRIVVRVPSREGLQVRHKLGYYAEKTG
jgi:Ca-activated chloride channel family protein